MGRPVAALSLVLAPAGAMVLPQPLAAQAPQTDIDRAVAALRGITTLRANFVQTDRTGQSVSGVLTLKRPGKVR
ncbi:MAG: LolA family protein, partial [Novosphingobium meiothermophilum]